MTDISYCKGVCVDLVKEVERLLAERDEWKQAAGAEADERRRAHDEIDRLQKLLQNWLACCFVDTVNGSVSFGMGVKKVWVETRKALESK